MQHPNEHSGSAPAAPLPAAVHARRREAVLSALGGGILVAQSAPELIRSRTTEVPYRQSSDLHYLTGFPEAEAVAVLVPFDEEHRFTLFLRERDPEKETWNGRRLGVEAAPERYGATAAYPIGELDERLPALLARASHIVYAVGHDEVMDQRMLAALTRARLARQRTGIGPTEIVELESVLGPMRQIKDAEEIERMRIAARIAAEGHLAAMRAARPGVGEWELQAALEATFRRLSGSGPAYPSIVGSGENATILHYLANDRRTGPDDLVLIDAGASYGGYCSDITRTFPVSGRFTPPQRAVYEIVLAAEEAAIAAAQPGRSRFRARAACPWTRAARCARRAHDPAAGVRARAGQVEPAERRR
jgi:Xaa-Pro aminopeptidase